MEYLVQEIEAIEKKMNWHDDKDWKIKLLFLNETTFLQNYSAKETHMLCLYNLNPLYV